MSPKPIHANTLFYGDNLEILREHIPDEAVDLIYLDPPFNSNRSYNVLFKDESGQDAEAQITAFDDTWHWGASTERTYHDLVANAPERVSVMLGAMREFIGANQMMAYLVMMTARLVELHRVLKPTGSLYLHCDPTASHYLKIILDSIFGIENYKNEVIWHYGGWTHQKMSHFPRKHDVILFYVKTDELGIFHPQSIPWEKEEYIALRKQAIHVDEDGREYIYDERGNAGAKRYVDVALAEGRPIDSVWDMRPLTSSSKERLGYPTQKPLALLERILLASSNPGDWVLDPFCGCGTAVAAAEKLGRRWIGIDITHLSIALQKYRLHDMFPSAAFEVIGEPQDEGSARQLAHDDRYQFQWWALSLIRARPLGGEAGSKTGKKGSDRGVDGVILFTDDASGKPKRVLVQVKSGHVNSGMIRDLRGTVESQKAEMGIFLTLDPPTSEMDREAVTAGYYHSNFWDKDYPRIQILSVAQIFAGAEVKMPPASGTFKEAPKEKKQDGSQPGLGL